MTHINTEMVNLFNDCFVSVYARKDVSSVSSFNLDYAVPIAILIDIDIIPSIVLSLRS